MRLSEPVRNFLLFQMGPCANCKTVVPLNTPQCLVCEAPMQRQNVPQASLRLSDKLLCVVCGTANPPNLSACVTCDSNLLANTAKVCSLLCVIFVGNKRFINRISLPLSSDCYDSQVTPASCACVPRTRIVRCGRSKNLEQSVSNGAVCTVTVNTFKKHLKTYILLSAYNTVWLLLFIILSCLLYIFCIVQRPCRVRRFINLHFTYIPTHIYAYMQYLELTCFYRRTLQPLFPKLKRSLTCVFTIAFFFYCSWLKNKRPLGLHRLLWTGPLQASANARTVDEPTVQRHGFATGAVPRWVQRQTTPFDWLHYIMCHCDVVHHE